MASDYPDDADGDALRRIAERHDMSEPIDIDFPVDAPDEKAAKQIAAMALARGYRTSIEQDDGRWTCYCTKRMVLTHRSVVDAQAELDGLSLPLGGRSDGWGALDD